jgi:hypothetical protein
MNEMAFRHGCSMPLARAVLRGLSIPENLLADYYRYAQAQMNPN